MLDQTLIFIEDSQYPVLWVINFAGLSVNEFS